MTEGHDGLSVAPLSLIATLARAQPGTGEQVNVWTCQAHIDIVA